MFGKAEYEKALEAYRLETSPNGSDEFTSLRRSNEFFQDVRSREDVEKQVKLFIELISSMDRDSYTNRYVVQTFIQDFCKFLDKDFLFFITDGSFFEIKEKVKKFTGEIYEINKEYTQRVGLHTLDHLLQEYSALIKFVSGEETQPESLWSGNRLW
jgi:hypothetical protein